MSNVTFSTILSESQMSKKSNTNRLLKTESGIDFKNDSIIVSAQNDVDFSKEVEATKNMAKASSDMDLSRVESNYDNTYSKYQDTLSLQDVAKAASEELATKQSSTLEKLAKSNETVAALTEQQTAAAAAISNFQANETKLQNEKSNAINQQNSVIAGANATISSLTTAKNSLSSQKSGLSTNLSSLMSQLAAIDEDAPDAEEQKAEIQEQIDEVNAQIAELDAQIAEKDTQIAEQQNVITNANAAKSQATTTYDALLSENTAKLNNAKNTQTTVTQNLATEVKNQTGLTLEAAAQSAQIVEAGLFERSVNNMLKSLGISLKTSADKKNEINTKSEEDDKAYEAAAATTEQKETILDAKTAERKEYYTNKEKEQSKSFLA